MDKGRAGRVRLLLGLAVASAALGACSTEPFQVRPDYDDPSFLNPATGPRDLTLPVPPKMSQAELPAFSTGPSSGLSTPFDYDPRPFRFALCYSSQLNTPRQVLERAQELCPQGGKVTLLDEDAFFNDCALFQPIRANFRCVPGPAPESPYK